jgi:hypothetical protein
MKCQCGCNQETPIAKKTDARRGHVKGQPIKFIAGHNSMVPSSSLVQVSRAPDELDDAKIRTLRSMPDAEAATVLDGRLRELERQYKRSFVERGLILLEVEQRELWKHILDAETQQPYESLDRWICGAATHSRSDCFAALKAVKELRDVPTEKLLDMPRCNVGILQSLSSAVRKKPEVIKAAQEMTAKEFTSTLQEHFPDQHKEQVQAMHLATEKTERNVIDHAIDIAIELEECKSREEAMTAICISYTQDNEVLYQERLRLRMLSGKRARA